MFNNIPTVINLGLRQPFNFEEALRFTNSVGGRCVDVRGWDVSEFTSLKGLFAKVAVVYGVDDWDVSNITDMSNTFSGCILHGDISKWDVSSVVNMCGMFDGTVFDPFNDISKWDVSNVNDMSYMFHESNIGNTLSQWDVSNVNNMCGMFKNCVEFDDDLGQWDVGNLTISSSMFSGCPKFTGRGLRWWDVGRLRYMSMMFQGGRGISDNLVNWNLQSLMGCDDVFDRSTYYGDINIPEASNSVSYTAMFNGCVEVGVNINRKLTLDLL